MSPKLESFDEASLCWAPECPRLQGMTEQQKKDDRKKGLLCKRWPALVVDNHCRRPYLPPPNRSDMSGKTDLKRQEQPPAPFSGHPFLGHHPLKTESTMLDLESP